MSKPVSIKEIDPEVLLYKRDTDDGTEFRMDLSRRRTSLTRWDAGIRYIS